MAVSLSQLFAAPPPSEDSDSLSNIFEEEPVPLNVFINDKKYLGQGNVTLSPVQSNAIKHIERIYLPSLYIKMAAEFGGYWEERIPVKNLITLQWGKGSGKDAVCRWASLRVAYMLLCLKSPQVYFGLPEPDSIHLLNIASSTGQANRAFFKPMTEAVKRGWFKDRAEPKQGLIQYDKNVEAVSGHSDAEGQEGLNLMLGVADEIDAFKAKGEMTGQGNKLREASTSAESILEMLKTSASSRFPESYKRVAISYPRYKGSTIQTLTKEGLDSQEKFGTKSIHFVSGPLATWEVNPRIKGKESFAEDYDKDPVGSAAKYECKPTRATDAYFRNMPLIKQAVDRDEQPIQVDYQLNTVRSQQTGDLVEVWEPVFTFHESFQPIQGARYAMHGDLAIRGDRAGVAMSHIESWDEQTEKVLDPDGNETPLVTRVPIVRNDFTIGLEADLTAKPPREIQVRWARKLAFELMSRGFPIVRFTFDGFQSADSIQLLNAHGVESKKVSADINDDVWKVLRDLAYSGRLHMPDSELLFTELDALSKVGGGKVDHPPQGSKDLADAFACSLLGALESGGEEDAEGKAVELGESLFKIGSSTMDLAGVETMSELFGDPLGLPFGMNEMGFYGYQ